MHRCTQSAAGGTIHRLKPGFATVRLLSRKSKNERGATPLCPDAVISAPPVDVPFLAPSLLPPLRLNPRASAAQPSLGPSIRFFSIAQQVARIAGAGRISTQYDASGGEIFRNSLRLICHTAVERH